MTAEPMRTVADVLARDLRQKIEEIVKVDQTDEQSVYQEITEYVVTDRLREQYKTLLRAIRDAQNEPHEGIGVWISGFFGSGKSFFAKNLGYILGNPTVMGQPAGNLFKAQIQDNTVADLIDSLNASIPTEVVMFDVSVEKSIKTGNEKMAEIMYRVLLRQLGYAEDFDIADIEFQLEGEGKLAEFLSLCQERFGQPWEQVRKGASKYTRASALLHEVDPAGHPTAESWSRGLAARQADITVGGFVERAFEMCARRRPGKALVFIIDEVGQYIARSADKMEDLRAVVEQFGLQGSNRAKKRQIVAPAWLVVTSQEKLEEVVAALDSKRVELAKLQDRFRNRVDLAPADIREVASRRVLAKTPDGEAALRALFAAHQGQLNAACRLGRSTRASDVKEDDFIQFYPYLPHFVELSIDIVSGIRLQPGATRHLGGSNRTLIKQAYEMLVSDRTRLADEPLGALVTLDRVFELVEGNLSTEKQKDISDIASRFVGDPRDGGMAVRVAKTIALLEYVRDLPRTEANIAACLVDSVSSPAPRAAVAQALGRLKEAQFIRETEEGWKLQTAQEKNWESERRSYMDPKPRERNEILQETLKDILAEPGLKTLQWSKRTFRLGAEINGSLLGEAGQITISLAVADGPEDVEPLLAQLRTTSREKKETIFWLMALNPQIDALVSELHASRSMISKYDLMRAQNQITTEEAASLQNERSEAARLQGRLREQVRAALHAGHGVFRGVTKSGPDLGKGFDEALRQQVLAAVPELYQKLPMAAVSLGGTEAETLLKAADLKGLPSVLYAGDQGLGLVKKEGANYVLHTSAPVAAEILAYLEKEHSYGNKETRTGKALESRFGGLGYGWDLEVLKLVLAALFRAGAIEVTSGGMRFDSYLEPSAWEPFLKNPSFRTALFTPATVLDVQQLKKAVEAYEALTGLPVDMEKNAIAAAIKNWAQDEYASVLPVESRLEANALPGLDEVSDYQESLDRIRGGTAEECVGLLAGEGVTLLKQSTRVRSLGEATNRKTLELIRRARRAVRDLAPVLREKEGEVPEEAPLQVLLEAPDFYQNLQQIKDKANAIADRYEALYWALHTERTMAYDAAIQELKGRPEWAELPDDVSAPLVAALQQRSCTGSDLGTNGVTCACCGAGAAQMESDLAALDGFKSKAVAHLIELTSPTPGAGGTPPAVRVHAAELLGSTVRSPGEVDEALDRLRSRLLELLDEGATIIIE